MRNMRDLWPEAPSIVILTGAGISQESGLVTFRDADGIWATVRLEEVATPEAFARDRARVLAFHDARLRQLQHPSVTPNAAHESLARLEAVRPGKVMIATQNIDDLHERAGSRAMIHMHGVSSCRADKRSVIRHVNQRANRRMALRLSALHLLVVQPDRNPR